MAGLTAAAYLSEKNIKVTLLESSPKLGGRASSFFYKPENMFVDNGQHILMGCYENTLSFIKIIGSQNELEKTNVSEIPFIDSNGKIHSLSAKKGFYPVNLLTAISNFTLLSKPERRKLISFLLKLKFSKCKKNKYANAVKLLQKNGQSEDAIDKFWKLIIASVFNCEGEKISAEVFINVIKIVFFSGKGSLDIILPKNSLAELFSIPAKNFIEKKNGIILQKERVIKIKTGKDRITEVVTVKKAFSDFDYVISALPYENLINILPEKYASEFNFRFEFSPILSAHLFLENYHQKKKYFGFVKSPIDWIFNKNNVISVVKSNSFEFAKMSINDIKRIIIKELDAKIDGFDENMLKTVKIIKERKATFTNTPETEEFRRKFGLKLNNLAIAGDWTNTKLPSTMESAVKSGFIAAEKILNLL